MKENKTVRENVEWLLSQYKLELEYEKKQEQEGNTDEDRSQVIWDYENVITELEHLLKISK